jgi:gliding motility-associated-like protein
MIKRIQKLLGGYALAYSSFISLNRFQKRLTSIIFLLLLGSSDLIAGEVSLSFTKGYLGTQASNTNTSDNIKNFTTLGISRVSFNQVDVNGDGLFGGGTQGNDLSGTIKIYLNSGQIISLNGALNWRETTGSTIEVFGIIFDANQTATINYGSNQSFVIRGGDVSRSSTSMGLKKYASAFTFVDGTDRSGNAANGMLDELNAELQNSPQPSTISAPTVVEGNNLVYTVTLNIATSANVPQAYTFTKSGTATASGDYTSTFTFSNNVTDNGDGTITVPGGVSSFTITASTIDDITPEATETLILNVGSKSGTGSITDNDVTLTTSVASLTAFSTCIGSASTAQSFTFSGNIYSGTVTVTAPTGFEISQTQNGTYSASIAYSFGGTSVAATTVWVRAKSTATNGLSGNVIVASTGATTQNVAVSVTVNTIPTITVSPSSYTIVVGGSVTLTASGGSTYSWSPTTGLSNSNTSSVTASPSSTISYTVTGTSAGGCSNTAVATVTVNAALSAGAIATDQTICVGATPASLTSTAAASGGIGTINYQWETSADNSTWSNVASATSATYSPGAISVNTYFRRKASTSTDAPVYTSAVLITVQQSVGGSIAGSAIVCPGTNSTVLTLSGYTGSITKWQSSLNSNFSAATDINSNTASVTVTNLNSTTYYRAVVTLGSCTAAPSGTASVTVNPAPTISINVIPDVNTSATIFTIPYSGLSNGDQYSINTGTVAMTGFSAVTNNSISSASGTITVTIPTSAQNSYDFNLTLTNSSTGCTTQRAFNLVVSNINPGTTGTDQSICYGTIPAPFTSLTAATSGATYQWQMSTTGITGNYTDISGATSDTYTHTTALTVDTYFRRKATLGSDFGTAHPVEVLVNALPTVSVTPSSATITSGSSVTLTASGATTYSWSPSTGLSASNTAAVTATPTATTTYTVTGVSASSCSSTANVTVTVNPALTSGTISADQTICVGATPVTLTSSTDATGGTGSIVYEWQSSTDGTTFTTISGATSSTYSPGAISVNTYFRRGASTANDAVVYSSAILITVQQSVGGSITGSATVCAGTNSTVLTLSGYTGSITKWQSALASNFSGATDITNTTSTLTATNLSTTTYYRAVITLGSCTAANSSSASVTVTALPSISISPSSASITSGSSVTLTASGATTYSWSPSTGLSASNTAAVTATPTATTTYTVTGTNSTTSCSSTATVTVTVNPALTSGTISADQTICVGATPATLTSSTDATGGTGSIVYEWQSSIDGTAFTTIAGATSSTYSPGAISVNTYFRRGASTSTDAVVYSSAILITVQQSVGGSIAGSATVCAGTNSTDLTLSGQTGSITKWQSSLTSNFASATDINNTTTTLTATNLSATTYYRAVIILGSCSAVNSSSASVTITALPSISVTPSSASITSGSSVTLTASGATTYSWSPSTGLSASNTAAVTATPTATTTYTVTGTRSSCSSTGTVTVTVTPANNAPVDTDGDGVLDTTETSDNTDPNDVCSYKASSQTLSPTSAWLNADCDGDGVTNGKESDDNTDPNDGCSYVVASKTLTPSTAWNALDCDGDGTPNGTDTAPKDPCVHAVGATPVTTNAIWRVADCDGDGVTNGKEADDNTNPNNGCEYKVASRTLTPSAAWEALDCDADGNPNSTDPNIDTPSASNDEVNVPSTGTVTVNILTNDDFLPGVNTSIERRVPPNDGTAKGTVSFNPLTGEMTYKRAPFESGLVTMGYKVTNNAVNPPVSSFAFVTILACDLADPLSDCDGDGELNGTDLAPTDPCVYEPSRQVKVNVSDDWKALDCDGDGVINGTELLDGTSASDACSFKGTSITLSPSAAWLLLDCDADGVTNQVEGTQDFDGDGIPNCLDTDSDGDSISDKLETTVDTDKDGKPDYLDLDSDNDGILDSVENKACTGTGILCDTDADGIPNFRDLDSDADQISDVIEASGSDYNKDGIADGNIDEKGIPSSANKGLTPPDTDRDGKLDPYDVDSDGDGILDFDEEYNEDADFADCDKDGIINRLDPDECDIFSPQGISPNGDGKNDRLVFKGLFLRKIPNRLSIFNRWGTLVFEMESYDNSFTGTLLPDGTYYYILDFFGKKPTISNYLSVDRTIK